MKKLELGCGDRPLEGYLHQDISSINKTKLDFECQPYEIPLKRNSLDEVIALGVMEHLTEEQFERTILKMVTLLHPDGGHFLFDVPDMKYWFKYATDIIDNYHCPFDYQHVENTILGWRRFPGDEHKSFWWEQKLGSKLNELISVYTNSAGDATSYNFNISSEPTFFVSQGIERNRFNRSGTDRHLYVRIYKFQY